MSANIVEYLTVCGLPGKNTKPSHNFQQARHVIFLYFPLKLFITCAGLTRTWNVETCSFSEHL